MMIHITITTNHVARLLEYQALRAGNTDFCTLTEVIRQSKEYHVFIFIRCVLKLPAIKPL